ncbi:retrovirus-related Pol polyprotein from transposon 412 [Trichonephila clavipes]|nr:retrovirus-related Pol polyprotein from transposon 412 [Trichonephila clavipes]
MQYQYILGIDFMKESKLTLDFDQKSLIIPDDQIKRLPKVEKPVEIDLSYTKLGEGQKKKLRNLFNAFKGLFSDQPGLTHVLYHYIDTGDKRPYRYDRVKQGIIDYLIEKMLQEENPDDGFVNATIYEGWSQDFKPIDGLLFYAKYYTNLGELRVYIPRSLREAIMKEFHDLPLAGHLGKRKTYLKLRDACYFPYMRKYIFEYVSTCDRCQKFNYKNALPAGRLIPIVSNYPNEIVTLDLLGPYSASRPERCIFLLVITDHFTKWSELIPLRKASALAIANAFFENYISRYGAPISLISDNGLQFISDVFEHLSHRLDIKHIKTGTYRPRTNLTERVNRTLVQMIACFVEENYDNSDYSMSSLSRCPHQLMKRPVKLWLSYS